MRLTAYIPKVGEPQGRQAHDRLSKLLISLAGGFTIYPGCSGFWRDNNGNIVNDRVTVYEAFGEDIDKEELTKELLILREVLNQDCIAYAIDNEIYFV